jgi:hypothetical protein
MPEVTDARLLQPIRKKIEEKYGDKLSVFGSGFATTFP